MSEPQQIPITDYTRRQLDTLAAVTLLIPAEIATIAIDRMYQQEIGPIPPEDDQPEKEG